MTQTIQLRVICIDPPIMNLDTDTRRFGLQDKNKNIQEGVELTPNQIQFDFELTVAQYPDGTPNFTGTFAHGARDNRFLYLSLMALQDTQWEIIQRIKVPLKSIIWKQVASVLADDEASLQVSIEGNRTGTVPLLGDGWTVQNTD